MPPRKKVAKVTNSTTDRGLGWGRYAAAQEASEEPARVVEDIAPPLYSQKGIVTVVKYQQAAQSTSGSDDELSHPSEAATSQKKRKRELVTADFTEEQELEMVDWLQAPQQNCLLNKKHSNYTRKGLKDKLWEQKARELHKTSDQLKKWYTNMRSRFGKLKQTPSGSGNDELTARDRWIMEHFEFLRPYLTVQVKKRMKAMVRARTAPVAAPSDRHPRPPAIAQSDADTSSWSRSRADDDTDIAELQKQLLNKLSKAEKSSMQRQKDSFAEYMKEVTYTFPPPMWLRFQGEVNSLMQEYQFELHQQHPPTHTQEDEFQSPYPPELPPGPNSEQSPSAGWQRRPTQVHQPTSVWGSQASLVQQQPPVRPLSAPPPTPQPSTSSQGKDTGIQHYTVYKSTIIKEENEL